MMYGVYNLINTIMGNQKPRRDCADMDRDDINVADLRAREGGDRSSFMQELSSRDPVLRAMGCDDDEPTKDNAEVENDCPLYRRGLDPLELIRFQSLSLMLGYYSPRTFLSRHPSASPKVWHEYDGIFIDEFGVKSRRKYFLALPEVKQQEIRAGFEELLVKTGRRQSFYGVKC